MENQQEHFRHIILFYFKKGKNTSEASKEICEVYRENVIEECVCQKWFARFRSGDFSLHDSPRSGQPQQTDNEQIKNNRRCTTREVAQELQVSKTTVENPHELSGQPNTYCVPSKNNFLTILYNFSLVSLFQIWKHRICYFECLRFKIISSEAYSGV
ncbi:Histone-lysine N-methyltransferase SETMAR [Habropoda laboriosa]|uniref:Histone-lysine N-methyltransferase SETMAR n=1 Tax=Habropoda laboriosa TaxID=597456 RepID=A0A0L7QR60_9HYME|nr:Histone-lysine N-methyltransferase SETMAR [Habropoda laboriosa]